MEKEIKLSNNGFLHLFLSLLMIASPLLLGFYKAPWLAALYLGLSVVGLFWLIGLFIVLPNQSKVLTFFGVYKGTVKNNGFYWLNPFYRKQKVSLRVRNLESDIIKVNDEQGNPILISAVVVWKVTDTYKATFNIETHSEKGQDGISRKKVEESYKDFVKIQAEAALRKVAHSYPYDNWGEEDQDVLCLRSGEDVINEDLAKEVSERLEIVGIEVLEARISSLSYAPEIAASMLQRQQAEAIIAARKKIVEGSVGMVEMALAQLEEKNIAVMNDDQKAMIIGNLMTVLCSDQATQPIVNTSLDRSSREKHL